MYQAPDKPHNHKCSKDGTIWHHDPNVIRTHAEFVQAHACPMCGAIQRFAYRDPNAKPQFCSNGQRCIMLDGSGKRITPHVPLPQPSRDHDLEVLQELAMVLGL